MTIAVRRSLAIAIGLLFALAGYFAATQSNSPANAAGTVTVHVKQASLNQGCGDAAVVGAHFVINQITSPPSTISVTLSDGTTHTVPLSKTAGPVAHYTLDFAAGLKVVDAVAMVPSNWTGQFVLSNYLCGPGTSSSTPPPSSSTTTPPPSSSTTTPPPSSSTTTPPPSSSTTTPPPSSSTTTPPPSSSTTTPPPSSSSTTPPPSSSSATR